MTNKGLDAHTTGDGEDRFYLFDGFRQLQGELGFALTGGCCLDNLDPFPDLLPCHSKSRGKEPHFLFASGLADGDTGSAARQQDLVVGIEVSQKFLDRFLLGFNHFKILSPMQKIA